jgi:hypothetical protein
MSDEIDNDAISADKSKRAKMSAKRTAYWDKVRAERAVGNAGESAASKKRRREIADEVGGEESPLAIYETARKALEWALRDLMRDDLVPAERRRIEIAKITSALASNKPLERMRQIEIRLKQEDAEINRVNAGVQLVNAKQVRPAGMVSRRGKPPRQSLR